MDVMTVLGPVSADRLGITLPHEHLFLNLFRVTRIRDQRLNDEPLAIDEVRRFREAGGGTIVELSNQGLEPDPAALRRVSEATGVNIVMGCGWYREPYYDHQYIARRTTADLAADFVLEIEEGEPTAGVRPGIIGEIGADLDFVSPPEEKVHRAAARAHLKTGLTITTHSLESPVGLLQLDLFAEEGVDLRRVIVGHAATWPFPDYHEAIARRGAYVQFDTIRGARIRAPVEPAAPPHRAARRGYLDRLLLSHDCCMQSHLAAYEGNGFAYIPTRFAARLREAGLSEEQVRTLLVENPRRALAGER